MGTNSTGDLPLDEGHRASNGADETPKRRNCRAGDAVISGLAKEYARGALSIIIKFNRETALNAGEVGRFVSSANQHITLLYSHDGPVWSYDLERGVTSSSEDGRDDSVFVRVVELVELIEVISTAAGKGFRDFEGVFHPLAGCHYSIAKGFEADPAVACGEFEVAVLRAVVDANQLPRGMIERAPEIVNCIAYYKGETARKWLLKLNSNDKVTTFRIALDNKSVRFFCDEGGELPFQIGDVILGPLDFLFSAIEHTTRTELEITPEMVAAGCGVLDRDSLLDVLGPTSRQSLVHEILEAALSLAARNPSSASASRRA